MCKEFEDFYKNIGNSIKSARLKKNYTREYLSELAGISSKFLYEIEIGKKGCSAYTLFRLVDALKIKKDYAMDSEIKLDFEHKINEIIERLSLEQINIIREVIELLYEYL